MRNSNKGFQDRRKTLQAQQRQELQERFTINNPNLRCPSSRPVVYLCTDLHCQFDAGFCEDQYCQPCSQHQPCQKIKLADMNNLVQNRSQQLKLFTLQYFEIQNKLLDSAMSRRRAYMEQAYVSGLDKKHLDLIEAIYVRGQGAQGVKGRSIDQLQQRLRDNETHREMVFSEDPLGHFQTDTNRINTDMQKLEKALFDKLDEKWGVKERPEVKSLQISKYGYYDITCSMSQVAPEEKKQIGHLSITNKVPSQISRAQRYQYLEQQSHNQAVEFELFSMLPYQLCHLEQGIGYAQSQINHNLGQDRPQIVKGIYANIFRINGTQNITKSPFIEELSQFTQLQSLELKVWHSFNDWGCFQDLANHINNNMKRLKRLDLQLPESKSEVLEDHRVKWTEKLRRGIKVTTKEVENTVKVNSSRLK